MVSLVPWKLFVTFEVLLKCGKEGMPGSVWRVRETANGERMIANAIVD